MEVDYIYYIPQPMRHRHVTVSRGCAKQREMIRGLVECNSC